MAYITNIDCKECGKTTREVTDYSGICQCCRIASSKKFRLHIASLKGLTVEERLERIEIQLYNLLDKNHRSNDKMIVY